MIEIDVDLTVDTDSVTYHNAIDPYKIYDTFEEALDRAVDFDDIVDDIIYWDKFPPGLGLEYTMH